MKKKVVVSVFEAIPALFGATLVGNFRGSASKIIEGACLNEIKKEAKEFAKQVNAEFAGNTTANLIVT